jgi:hypothetical protein
MEAVSLTVYFPAGPSGKKWLFWPGDFVWYYRFNALTQGQGNFQNFQGGSEP